MTVASRVTVPAWRKVRISGTLEVVSNGAGSWSTTSSPNGLRVRVPCAGMARSLTTTLGPASPSRTVRTTCRAIGLRTATSWSGVPLRLRMVRNVVAAPADAAARGVKARIGTAARLTWSRTRDRVPAPPEATHADSSPVSTTAQITGPNAARARSRSTFRPGSVRAGAALGAAVAVTGRPPRENARPDWPARRHPAGGQAGDHAGRGNAAAAGCCRRRSASWPTWRSRRTAG